MKKKIIKWITWNLTPERARVTVQNHLKEEGEEARRTGHEIKKFHDLIMSMVEQFEGAYRLGVGEKPRPSRNSRNTRNPKGKKGNEGEGRSEQPEGGQSSKKNEGGEEKPHGATNPKMKSCVWCNQLHDLNKCPTLPEETKKWSWYKVLKERRKREISDQESRKNDTKHVRFF